MPLGEARSTSLGVWCNSGGPASPDLPPDPDEASDSGRHDCAGEGGHVRRHVHGLAVRGKVGLGLVAGGATVEGSALIGHERHSNVGVSVSDRRASHHIPLQYGTAGIRGRVVIEWSCVCVCAR
jgi:hypothetical protein